LEANIMSNSCNISSLKTLSCDLLNGVLKEIRSHRENTSPTNEEYFLTAEYLLQEAMEYVDGSWEVDRDKTEERLKVLVGEALRCDACLLEGLAELWTDKSRLFESKAEEARRIRKSLGVEKPESLDGRLEEIRQTDKTNWPELYALYRICCAAAHPNLKVWERFCSVASSTSSKDPIDKQPIACWMAAASTLYLVTHAYCLTELGNIDVLKHWWEKQVVPLLI
jgi:hypothetical protein